MEKEKRDNLISYIILSVVFVFLVKQYLDESNKKENFDDFKSNMMCVQNVDDMDRFYTEKEEFKIELKKYKKNTEKHNNIKYEIIRRERRMGNTFNNKKRCIKNIKKNKITGYESVVDNAEKYLESWDLKNYKKK